MSNEIIKNIGQVVGRTLLDGARLGTAAVVGDLISRKIKKVFRSKEENTKEEERTNSHALADIFNKNKDKQ